MSTPTPIPTPDENRPLLAEVKANVRPTYRIREAFEALRISHQTGYQLINRGLLRTYKIGAMRYVSGEELVRFVREREAAEPPPPRVIAARARQASAGRLGLGAPQ